MSVLSIRDVGKKYRLRRETRMFTNELLRRLLRRYRAAEFWALRGITFDVEAGESLGIIGPNGSGKSTLLRVIAGVTECTEGEVSVQGRVASLLELGTGFHPYLTGRENVYLNGAILGIRREEIERNFAKIVEFAGIGRFIDVPVKDYSSGMYVRLAFAVAINSDPDIFLVDEVLAVGDEEFQQRCRAKIRELQASGKTIVFVSHDLNIVNELCDRVILLREGRIIEKGSTERTINFYLQTIGRQEGIAFLKSGPLELIFNNGKIALFSDAQMLTRTNGGYTSIFSRGMWYESTGANWHVEKCTDTELVATGAFTRIPIQQEWRIKLEDPSLVLWDVEMEGKPGAEASLRTLSLVLSPEYTGWFTEDGVGEFPRIEFDDTRWVPVLPRDEQLKVMGVVAGEDQSALPSLYFEAEKRVPHGAFHILNSEYAINARILQLVEPRPEEERQLVPRNELFVSARIGVGQSPERIQQRLREARHERAIDVGDLTALFAGGKVRLSWQGSEITKRFCAFASIQSGDLWDDSAQAYWQLERVSDLELRATGMMRRLPAVQTWTLRRLDDRTLEWKICLEVKERFETQEIDVSIMLVPEYETWQTSHETGVFPPITAETKEWTHLTSLLKQSSFIEASCNDSTRGNLPRVRLSFGEPRVGAAVNTGYEDMARIIQGLKPYGRGSGIFEPGYYEVFSGSIIVG